MNSRPKFEGYKSHVMRGVVLLLFLQTGSVKAANSPIPLRCLYEPSKQPERYVGCFTDEFQSHPDKKRQLPFLMQWGSSINFWFMTNDVCIMVCADRGYLYAGTQVGLMCFCGHDPYEDTFHGITVVSECNIVCTGENTAYCGGTYRNTVYRTGLTFTNESTTKKQDFTLLTDSVGLYGDLFAQMVVSSQAHCAALCGTFMKCRVFSFLGGNCQLFTLYDSGICYPKSWGTPPANGKKTYILKL